MISKINITEFRKRLIENTKYGNPKIKGTPFAALSFFGKTNKKFYGRYNETKFELTKNNTIFLISFIIFGEFKSKNTNETEISYQIKPIGFGYYWIKYMPIFSIIIFNFILYSRNESIKLYLIINTFIITIILISRYDLMRKKNKLITIFNTVFEIER